MTPPSTLLPPVGPLVAEGTPGPEEALADAVYLLRRQEVSVGDGPRGWFTTIVNHHRTLILTERGLGEASFRVEISSGTTLLALEARTISPEGAVIDVEPEEIIEGESRSDDDATRIMTFRFPRASVGSILEARWAIGRPTVSRSLTQRIASTLPTRRFEQVFFTDPAMRTEFLVRNADPHIETAQRGPERSKEMGFALDHVAADREEPFSPSAADRGPWWILRVVDYDAAKSGSAPFKNAWVRALPSAFRRRLTEGEGMTGVPAVDVSACASERDCIATRLLGALRSLTDFRGFADRFEARALNDVVASGGANSHEKTLLLWKMFQDAGVTAYCGATSRQGGSTIVEDFPSSFWVNHSVVYLPATSTSPAHIIDPACEACALGDIPPWSLGRRAFFVDHTRGAWGVPLKLTSTSRSADWDESPFLTIEGRPALIGVQSRTVDVTVEANGDVVVRTEEVHTGADAVFQDQRQRIDGDDVLHRQLIRELHREVGVAARLEEFEMPPCDAVNARCQRRYVYRLPGLAIALPEEGHWLVPLTMLRSKTADTLAWRSGNRRHAIHTAGMNDRREVITLHPPPGHRFTFADVGHREARVDQLMMSADVVVDDKGALVVERRFNVEAGVAPARQWPAWQTAAAPFIALGHRVVVARRTADANAASLVVTDGGP